MFQEIREDLNGKINRNDIDDILGNNEQVKKSFSEMATRHELKARVEIVMSDYNKKLEDKISMANFKKIISTYDSKMSDCVKSSQDAINEMEKF